MAENENKKVKGINLVIQETREKLTAVINEAGLPPACLMLIVGEIMSAVAELTRQCTQQELADYQAEENKKEEEA